MSKKPRALQELMTAVDAGDAVDVYVASASSDSRKLLGPRRWRSTNNGHSGGGGRKSAPAVAVVEAEASTDASFEFSAGAVGSYSSASPASMVFSDGQLRAHQFPAVAVRSSSSSSGSSQATSTSSSVRSSSVGSSSYSSTSTPKQQEGVRNGSKKRVSFAADGADNKAAAAAKAGGGQGRKKNGGLLGCMASTCGPSLRNEAVEPVARNHNRKVVAF